MARSPSSRHRDNGVIVVIPAPRLPSHIRTAAGNDRSSFTVAKRLNAVLVQCGRTIAEGF
jgi:hypothetical protein